MEGVRDERLMRKGKGCSQEKSEMKDGQIFENKGWKEICMGYSLTGNMLI